MKVGSLFTGCGGLDMAAEAHYGARTVWTSDIDPGACKIIAHRMPGIPNLGDITKIDWAQVEPVDILTGGFPCQDLSHAGKRAGLRPGTRSGLWSHMAYAISQLRPRYVVAENVRGLLSASADSDLESCPWCLGGPGDGEPVLRALGCVLGDLAELGYDTRVHGLRAADVGAPHGRFRVFVVATDTTHDDRDRGADARTPGGRSRLSPTDTTCQPRSVGHGDDVRAQRGADGRRETSGRGAATDADHSGGNGAGLHGSGEWWWPQSPDGDCDAADADQPGPQGRESAGRRDVPDGCAPANPPCDGRHEGWPEPAWEFRGSDAALSGAAAHADSTSGETLNGRPGTGDVGRYESVVGGRPNWGDYAPAIDRWARVLGRPAPAPTEAAPKGGQRLSPRFVEWMMGLPAGWVTEVPGLSRNAQLKALGNGVVPQQALAALRILDELRAAA